MLLSHGPDPDVTTVSSQTAVHLAIDSCPSALPGLQKAGATFGSLTKTARWALHIACALGNISADLRCSLETLDPNARDHEGATPTHALVKSRNPDIAAAYWLISLGADLNLLDIHHISPLYASISEKNYRMAEYILSKGAHAGCKTGDSTLPGLVAILASCKILLSPNLLSNDSEAGSFLHRAVTRQKPEEVRGLLYYGLRVDCRNARGTTPLHLAVLLAPTHSRHSTIKPQRSNITSLLLQNHANPHEDSYNDSTPIHITVIRDSITTLRQLLGASRSSMDKSQYLPDGTSILALSSIHSSPACFEHLLKFAHQGHDGNLDPSHFIDTLLLLLNYPDGTLSEDELASRIQTYRKRLNVALVLKEGLGQPTDASLQECSLRGVHKLLCTSFNEIYTKIVLLGVDVCTTPRSMDITGETRWLYPHHKAKLSSRIQ